MNRPAGRTKAIRRFMPAAMSVFLFGLAIAGCAGGDDRPVTIGAMYNLTGAQKNLDGPSSEGAQLAVDQANRKGGVLGRRIDLLLVNGRSDPALIATEAAKVFNEAPVAGLIGFSDTDMVLAAAPVAARKGRVFLTSGATSPKLPAAVPDFLFLACFGDNVQAAAGAEWAFRQLKARRVAVLYNDATSYTRLLHGYFETRFKELGGTVVSVQAYRPDGVAFRAAEMRQADLVYLAAYPDEVTTVIPMLRKEGITAPILGGDGLDIGGAWKAAPATRDVYFTTHAYLGADNPDPAVRRFRADFARAYPGRAPDAFTALGYDAARLLIAAIRRAGTAEPAAVRKALSTTDDFEGVTGRISFTDGSRIPSKSVTIMRVGDGRQSYVDSVRPDSVPAP